MFFFVVVFTCIMHFLAGTLNKKKLCHGKPFCFHALSYRRRKRIYNTFGYLSKCVYRKLKYSTVKGRQCQYSPKVSLFKGTTQFALIFYNKIFFLIGLPTGFNCLDVLKFKLQKTQVRFFIYISIIIRTSLNYFYKNIIVTHSICLVIAASVNRNSEGLSPPTEC